MRRLTAAAARHGRRFLAEQRGGVALIFGLSIFVLIAAAGLAMDTSRINQMNMRVSSALDAAALATAKQMRLNNSSDSELAKLAQTYFDANLRAQNMNEGVIDRFAVELNRDTNEIAIIAEASLPTSVGRVFNLNTYKTALRANAVFSARDIELGMMLDVSGSMGGTKISQLRSAAKDLVNIILDETRGPTANRIGIAPYSSAVNAGSYAQVATNSSQVPSSSCVTERSGTYAFTDASPFTSPLTRRTSSCPSSSVVPLTSNVTTLENRIDQLSAGGSTAGHLGIAWAWYIVSPNWNGVWPSQSEPKPYSDKETLKAVIIMTDGEFNTAYLSANGNSTQQAGKLCQNIKSNGLTVFSVGFEAPAAALDVLRQCASKSSYFFDAKNGDELRDAFTRIANELTGLRLSM
ncbi:MAG: VWA domain-containing protein [Hyphomicrobiaceae bacterium]|nr:VWA domain-containing protein [Hyphomicrobiaceae bacterium]